MIVYELTHVFRRQSGHLVMEPLSLGFYASLDDVQHAICHYLTQPGFCENPDAFSIRRRTVTGSIRNLVFFETIVYFHTDDYAFEYSIELGLFGDESQAQVALSIFVRDNKQLFDIQEFVGEKIINKCILGRREWSEGVSIT